MWFGFLPIGQGILGHSQEVKEDFTTRSSGQGARILTPVADGFIACLLWALWYKIPRQVQVV